MELIADFLDFKIVNTSQRKSNIYRIPKEFYNKNDNQKTIDISWFLFEFNTNWNWLMFAWDELHRKVLIPSIVSNPHLRRELNDMIKEMRNNLKWVHIDECFKTLIKMIKWYNEQLEPK